MKIKIKSPAKVNLHLEILNKRPDGYHNLFSLFQMINLYDEIEIKTIEEKNCIIKGNFNFPTQDNLIYKAYQKYSSNTEINFGIEVKIKKNIPMGGGLGGGSSNAAAILKALNFLNKIKISESELQNIGVSIGSDVPFFLTNPSAVVSGRGEIINSIDRKINYHLLLVIPGFYISTKQAFSDFDKKNSIENLKPKLMENSIVSIYSDNSKTILPFFNSFTDVIIEKEKSVKEIMKDLKNSGSDFISISGSGSTIFGLFYDKKMVKMAKNCLKNKYPVLTIVKPLDRNPLNVLQ